MRILEKQARESGREYALRVIKENLISMELAPGSLISENELAGAMGLSRTPVREAILELSHVGIVTVVPQKKSVVSLIDYSLVEEAQFMRDVMETAVLEQVCEMSSEEDISWMEDNIRLQRFYLENDKGADFLRLDNELHHKFFVIAKKEHIYELMQNLSIHFDRVRSLSLNHPSIGILEDHEKILTAIRQKDPEHAKEQLHIHLNRYKIDALSIREKYPQYFV